MFSCDHDPHVRATIGANFSPGVVYPDITSRKNEETPELDVYVAGFPCQPFSIAGLGEGFNDGANRGKIFFYVLDYIRRKKPKVFILENVPGLVHRQHGKYHREVMKELRDLGIYNVRDRILDTKENGIPHSRRRWYCVGILKSIDDGSFEFPSNIPCADIELFLEKQIYKWHRVRCLQHPKPWL